VWGRIRSKKAAAKAESAALEADYEFARQSLAAAVARAYFTTIEAAQQEANAQETLDLYQEYSKLTDVQKAQGFASDFERVADQVAHRQRRGCTLHSAAARRRRSGQSKSSPAATLPADLTCDVPFPATESGARRSACATPRTPARPHR